mgnify:CR=1 FL=1
MAYITQYHTWTDETITAANLNGNITNITDGLSDGTKDINVGSVKINGSTAISDTGVFTGDITGDITGTVSDISNHEPKDLSDITDTGSGIIISGTERTNFTSAYTDTQAASDTENALSPAATIVKTDATVGGKFLTYNTRAFNTLNAYAYVYLDTTGPRIENHHNLGGIGPTITWDAATDRFSIEDIDLGSRDHWWYANIIDMEPNIYFRLLSCGQIELQIWLAEWYATTGLTYNRIKQRDYTGSGYVGRLGINIISNEVR